MLSNEANLERTPGSVALVGATILVCLNLRVVFGGVGPMIPYLHLPMVTASILTALPPLCMGLFAPLGPYLGRRYGSSRALSVAMLVLITGIVVRSCGPLGLLPGTVIASAGIAALNVLTPVYIRHQFAPEKLGVMMGVYAMMMGGGGGLMAALVVPIYYAAGHSSGIALGVAALPAVAAILALLPLSGATPLPQRQRRRPSWRLLRRKIVWSLIAFFGIQTLAFYAILAWLPAIFISKGADPEAAGFTLAICIFAVALGGFLGPSLAARHDDQRAYALASIGLCIVGLVGIELSALSGLIWVVLLGIGLGAGQGLPGVLFAKRSANPGEMAELSGIVQLVGYVVAASGPLLMAGLHGLSGGWQLPLHALLALLLVNAVVSLPGGHGRVAIDPE